MSFYLTKDQITEYLTGRVLVTGEETKKELVEAYLHVRASEARSGRI